MNKRVVAIKDGRIVSDNKSGGYVIHDLDMTGAESYTPGDYTNSFAEGAATDAGNKESDRKSAKAARKEKKEKKRAKEEPKSRASVTRRTITNLSRQTLSGLQTGKTLSNLNQPIEVSDAEVDQMLSEYLNGGEDIYE